MAELAAVPLELLSEYTDKQNEVLELSCILLQCFAVIVLGYIAGRFELITESGSAGLTNFVSYFSLPVLIFQSLAQSDLSQIDWNFVLAVGISKGLIFTLVVVVTLITSTPSNIGKAGMFGLFATIGNDFAMGYPLFVSLYREDHPNFPDYLYVVAPIQFVILNPIGIFMMELHRYRQQAQTSQSTSKLGIIAKVSTRTLLNPIIVMTLGGLMWNIGFRSKIPIIIKGLLRSLADTFAPTSLFLLGLKIVSEASAIKGFSKFKVPCTLTGVKLIVFPLLLRFVSQHLVKGDERHIEALSNFGFLYGTIPAAPTSVILSLTYNIAPWVMSSGLIISTVVSAPLMFVSASMIRFPDGTTEQFAIDMRQSMGIISLISIPCAIWTLFMFICGRKWTSVTHRMAFLLILSQAVMAISSYAIPAEMNKPKFYHLIPIFAIFVSRFLTTIISLTLSIIHRKSLSHILRLQTALSVATVIACAILTGMIYFLSPNSSSDSRDYEFPFGFYQVIISLGVLTFNMVVTTLGVIVQQRRHASFESYQQLLTSQTESDGSSIVSARSDEEANEELPEYPPTNRHVSSISEESQANGIYFEDRVNQSAVYYDTGEIVSAEDGVREGDSCINSIRCYWSDLRRASLAFDENTRSASFYNYVQINIHSALLLLLLLGMIVGCVTSLSKVMGVRMSGISKELVFLDIFLNNGQAIATFILFGLDFTPLIDLWRCLTSQYSSVRSMDKLIGDAVDDTLHICQQFYTYHREKCAIDVCFAINYGSKEIPVFKGCDLVKWLVESGLSPDRKSAQIYALHLFRGNVVTHVYGCTHFLDTSSLYQFAEEWMPSSVRRLTR